MEATSEGKTIDTILKKIEDHIKSISTIAGFIVLLITSINTTIGIVTCILLFAIIIIYLYIWWKNKTRLDRSAFQKYVNDDIYIPMEVTDPQSDTPDTRVPFFKHFIEIIRRKQVDSWFICLLGDIGSGKTGAMVHLFLKYAKWYSIRPSMPSSIKLYTMNVGYKKLKERIDNEIPSTKKRNTILLLDALDECEEARESLKNTQDNNPRIFMMNLAKDFEGFALVMVSCRKQFFQQEMFTPGSTGVKNGDVYQRWYQLHLQPFDKKQVEMYLAKRFNGSSSDPEKDEARRIVSDCKEEFLRPIILSNIDIILKEFRNHQKPLTRKEIYDAIILFWIKREAEDEYDHKREEKIHRLLKASLCTAAYMYKHKLNYLDNTHYEEMCKEHGIDDSKNLLRVKSLLTNDKKDSFRFVHQSFYEHLLAYWFFLHPWDIDSLQGLLESTLSAYKEILNEDKEKACKMSRLLEIDKVDDYTIALGLHTIGLGLYDLNHFSEAEPFYEMALGIFRKMEENHSGKFINKVAMTLNNLANSHSKNNRNDEAEKEYQEVLEILRELAKKNPDAYLPKVAQTLNNLGVLHWNTNRYDEAEKEYKEALKIRRELAEKNPDAYLPDVALTLNNLAILHYSTKRYDEAEKEYQETLETYQKLADKNPDAYQPHVATTLNNLAALHKNINRYDETEKEHEEALQIRQALAEKNPDAFLPDVAMTLFNIALLRIDKGELADAEEKAKESLELYQQMAEISHAAFDKDVEDAKQLLADIQNAR